MIQIEIDLNKICAALSFSLPTEISSFFFQFCLFIPILDF